MKKLLTLFAFALGAFSFANAQSGSSGGAGTVADYIANSPDHTTLTAALQASGLDAALSGPGPYTVFAPTDNAFDALPPGVVEGLLEEPEGLLTDILLYHVLGFEALSGDLSDGQMVMTLNGQDVTVTIDNGVFINDAEVILADQQADNGVVHVIDAVLVPEAEAFTVWDIIMESPVHSTLEAAVLAAELEGALDDEGASLTVFAPTDNAFAALPAGLLDDLLADPQGLLTQILLYHVLGFEALSGDLSDGQMVMTLNGQDVTVTIDNGVFINDAEVILADQQAENGVVHVIDAVLVPEAEAFTVWDIIMESPVHSTLEAAVLAAELEGALDDEGASLTVFAPTDNAFAALPAGLLDDLLADPQGLLTQILLYHVLGFEALSGDLSDGQMVMTLNGQDVTVTIDNGVFINDAEVILADQQADNGVVHVIDAVLVPEAEAFTVWDIIMESPVHSTLEAAVLAAELEGALDDEGASLTVFAPTDNAFAALPAGLLDDLLADPQGLLTQILLYHVLGFEALSGDLSDGQMVMTLNGQDVTVTIDNGVFINDAEVILADQQADNGVVHVIDAVLVPEAEAFTVWDIIMESPVHSTLEAAVLAAELEGALDDEGASLTVFAPTDNAFAALPAGLLDDLLADPQGLLTQILLYHVLGFEALSGDLSDGQMVMTLNGQDVTVTIDNGVFINDAEVILADQQADNGVVHVIDAVLVPEAEAFTVWDIIMESPVHSTLEAAVLAAELEGALDDEGASLTVFAPTDNAFAALPAGLLDDLLADPQGLLTQILLYHVLGFEALSGDLSDGQMVMTLNGQDVTVTIDNGVFINDAEVILADQQADNGVVHVIDAVLVPEAEAFTVWDIIMESPVHSTLEAAVLAAELEGALDDEGASLTVFAPTDNAFAALPAGLLDDLLADPQGLLTQILLYHVLGFEALSGDLSDGQMVMTLNGQDVTVTIDNGVFINDAEVILADQQADNGVVHVIDAVLVPESTGVEELEGAQVNLFPNPTTGQLNVELNNISINTGYRVVNATGAIVENGTLQPGLNNLDLSDLSKGLYLIDVFTENGHKTQRLVIR